MCNDRTYSTSSLQIAVDQRELSLFARVAFHLAVADVLTPTIVPMERCWGELHCSLHWSSSLTKPTPALLADAKQGHLCSVCHVTSKGSQSLPMRCNVEIADSPESMLSYAAYWLWNNSLLLVRSARLRTAWFDRLPGSCIVP